MKEKILELRKQGLSYNKIALTLNCSSGTVGYHCGINQKEKHLERQRKQRRKAGILPINKTDRRSPIRICKCGTTKDKRAELCHKCKVLKTFNNNMNKPIGDIISNGNARVKWATLRKLALQAMEIYENKKECKLCGFDSVVEVCHIKPIKEFPLTSLVKEVNSQENLIYLCPNHHTMMDKGMVNLLR